MNDRQTDSQTAGLTDLIVCDKSIVQFIYLQKYHRLLNLDFLLHLESIHMAQQTQ